MAADQQLGQAEPEVDYPRQWRAYGRRRGLALLLLAGFPPVCFALFWWSRHTSHQPLLALLGMLAWWGGALAAVWWAGEFRCPRCRRRYAALGNRKPWANLTRGLFDKVCWNCKLRKFERQ